MSAGERYGISTHLAEPDEKCRLGICDGSGWFVPLDEVGKEQVVYHHPLGHYCPHADRDGGCAGHLVWTPCLCTADRRHP